MIAAMEQLRIAYEQENMTPEQIAEDLEWDVVAVKAALTNCSSRYRKASGQDIDLDFSDSELNEVNSIIMDTARHATRIDGTVDYKVRLDAAKYIRDDKKGRKELQKALGGNQFNLLQFNNMLQEGRQAMKNIIPAHLLSE